MLLETFAALAFILFGIGLAVAFIPVVRPSIGDNKSYLVFAKGFCSVTTLVWLLVSLFCPGSDILSQVFIVFAVVLFGWFSIHFNQRTEDVKK